jgi:hypothetical protein
MTEIQLKLHDKYLVKVKGETTAEAVRALVFFESIPGKCPRCGAPVRLHHRQINKNKEMHFYELVCEGEDRHSRKLGEYNDGDLFIPYKDKDGNKIQWLSWQEIKNSNARSQNNSSSDSRSDIPPDPPMEAYDDDLPF